MINSNLGTSSKRKCNNDQIDISVAHVAKKPKLSTILSHVSIKGKGTLVKQKSILANSTIEPASVKALLPAPTTNIRIDNCSTTSMPNEVTVDSSHNMPFVGESRVSVSSPCITSAAGTSTVIDQSSFFIDYPPVSDSCAQAIIPFYFSSLPYQWFENQARLVEANKARTTRREKAPVSYMGQDMVVMNRSECTGFIEENLKDVEALLSKTKTQSKRDHLKAICLVGELFLSDGPIIATQNAAKIYSEYKNVTLPFSSEFYEIISKHLNFTQVYISGKAYLIENRGTNVTKLLQTLEETLNAPNIVNDHVKEKLSNIYGQALKYMDTPRDRQLLKGIIAHITSVKCAVSIQGIQSRLGTAMALRKLVPNLEEYKSIQMTSQIVRNDLTNLQQYRLTQRIVSARKHKEMMVIAKGRGRKLKCEEFPELAATLTFAFGERGLNEDNGLMTLESHPRLTTSTLYRPKDNVISMKEAREVILLLSPERFKISLSSCYNYTQNYRKGSRQAKQHHYGKPDVNADISLSMPSRSRVSKVVVNLHWSTSNVNNIVDSSEASCIISKDAKCIIPSDIQPVQHPGRSWQPRSDLDHTWDQSRVNSVTPMTFLVLQTRMDTLPTTNITTLSIPVSESVSVRLTRTGQPITLLYLSFFEPQTTYKSLNELFLLLSLPCLDIFFRDSLTHQLKDEFIFVVDNGPSECPSSILVKMCLVRFMLYLNLKKVIQVSFAEYHSKRNFVERVHAAENRALSSYGPFKNNAVYNTCTVGSTEHKSNMEHMAQEVRQCLLHASFGQRQLQCFRGVQKKDYVFDDEEKMDTFLSLTKENKKAFTNVYSPTKSYIVNDLQLFWGVKQDYVGNYYHDYQLVRNEVHVGGNRTSWIDKYTTSIYNPAKAEVDNRYEYQPLPDYIRWRATGELHYLSLNQCKLLEMGPWNNIPGIFLPSHILQLCFSIVSNITCTEDHLKQFALMSWIPLSLCQEVYEKHLENVKNVIDSDVKREKWKEHPLYATKKRNQLEDICKSLKIPVHGNINKVELVQLISEHNNEAPPHDKALYSGEIARIPTTQAAISKLPVSKLRAILKWHGISILGSKDELILRVQLLRAGKTASIFNKEEAELRQIIEIAQ